MLFCTRLLYHLAMLQELLCQLVKYLKPSRNFLSLRQRLAGLKCSNSVTQNVVCDCSRQHCVKRQYMRSHDMLSMQLKAFRSSCSPHINLWLTWLFSNVCMCSTDMKRRQSKLPILTAHMQQLLNWSIAAQMKLQLWQVLQQRGSRFEVQHHTNLFSVTAYQLFSSLLAMQSLERPWCAQMLHCLMVQVETP